VILYCENPVKAARDKGFSFAPQIFFRPFQGLFTALGSIPTAHAVGYILSPLRGWDISLRIGFSAYNTGNVRTMIAVACVAVALLVSLVGMIAPVLIDARRWWPRRHKK